MTWPTAGDRVAFTLAPSEDVRTGTVVEVRDPVPQRDPRIRSVDNTTHVLIADDRGGQAAVELSAIQKLED
ncbi:hypothetical protein [Mycolicibacterium aubagnense]|uniref:Hypervirulence associated protein TUDOR domain-containing protein n=1 Tax=Mycolicibacterium aubagnense TaxID=319707 RepID=A0ABN5Z1C5_9MYCO|nr:hypothetical protein [Mycolicibacterium aubagnense]TLH48572.1 hypothetical protein C1S80_29780 [Mycolicibacterium aubagnense]BBX87976.1 hypothetical protein MAUB_58490 [Mycolicibacterium aubagnense]